MLTSWGCGMPSLKKQCYQKVRYLQSSTGSYNMEKSLFKRSNQFNIKGAHIYGIHINHREKQLFIAPTVCSLIISTSHYTAVPLIGLCYPSKSGAVTFPCPTGSFISSCISSLFLFLEFILASTSLLICPIWFAEIECTQLSAFWDIVKFDVYSIKNWVRI